MALVESQPPTGGGGTFLPQLLTTCANHAALDQLLGWIERIHQWATSDDRPDDLSDILREVACILNADGVFLLRRPYNESPFNFLKDQVGTAQTSAWLMGQGDLGPLLNKHSARVIHGISSVVFRRQSQCGIPLTNLLVSPIGPNNQKTKYRRFLAAASSDVDWSGPLETHIIGIAAQHIGIAVQAWRTNRERVLLQEVSETLSDEINLDEMLDLVLQSLHHVFACDYAHILRLARGQDSAEDSELEVIASTDQSLSQGSRLRADAGFSGWIVANGKFLRAPDLGPTIKPYNIQSENGIQDTVTPFSAKEAENDKCILGVPLRFHSDTIGVILITSTQDGRAFNLEDDPGILQIFADQAAIAIRNAELRQKLRERNREVEAALARISNSGELVFSAELSYVHLHQLKTQLMKTIEEFELLKALLEPEPDCRMNKQIAKEMIGAYLRDTSANLNLLRRQTTTVGSRVEILRFDPRPQDLGEIVDEVVSNQSVYRAPKSIGVSFEVSKTLGETFPILADRFLLAQAITNVVVNAIQAVGEVPKRQRKIKIQVYSTHETINLDVTDYGPGIRQEYLPTTVFEPFFTTKAEGTGIGLFMAKRIITHSDYHDGKITCRSFWGKQTTVSITIPRFA